MKRMTMKERILAIVKGGEVDEVPFVQYSNLAAPNEEIWDEIGRENMGVMRWTKLYRIERPNCRETAEPIEHDGLKGQRTVAETPRGALTQVKLFEPAYGTGATREHFVKTAEDYGALSAYLQDCVVVEDMTAFHTNVRELGEDGVPLVSVERTPFQQLWVQWVCINDLALHMVDCPERVAPCIGEMTRIQRDVFEIVARAPLDFVDFPDNVTAPIIGEPNFRRYCVPAYGELAEMLAERGIPIFCHADGDLKPLWGAIGESALRGLDSLSPPPDNDTSVAEAIAMWPEMRLFLNFPSSVHLRSPEAIYRQAMDMLEQGGHTGRLQIQISENTPRGVWRKSYPQIVRAIMDFGKS